MLLIKLTISLTWRDSVLLERCPHDRRIRLNNTDRFASYTTSWCKVSEDEDSDSHSDLQISPLLWTLLTIFRIAHASYGEVYLEKLMPRCCLNLRGNVCEHSLFHLPDARM